jgi:thermitase
MGARTLPQHRAVTGALILALCWLIVLGAADRVQAAVEDFEPGQVIVKLEPNGATIEQINAAYGTTILERFPHSSDIYLLKLPADSGVQEMVTMMAADERLLYAEPNFIAQAPEGDARHRAFGISDAQPSSEDYAYSALNLSRAHDISRGEGTTIAVLDTGVDLDHPTLEANFAGVQRYDFVNEDDDPSAGLVGADADGDGLTDELWGHGTHVAGIVDQVAPAAKIMPLQVLDNEGYGNFFTIAKAVSYAGREGSDVINLSLGTPSRSMLLGEVIEDVIKNGSVVACAAGNSNTVAPYYPAAGDGASASADGLVAVTSVSGDGVSASEDGVEAETSENESGVSASVDGLESPTSVNMTGQKSDFANYGHWVDLAGPGEGIRSAFPFSVYASWSGTSMATPFVSGQAALIRAVDGSLHSAGVEERIRCSARSLVESDPTYATLLGAGQADVGASVEPGVCS